MGRARDGDEVVGSLISRSAVRAVSRNSRSTSAKVGRIVAEQFYKLVAVVGVDHAAASFSQTSRVALSCSMPIGLVNEAVHARGAALLFLFLERAGGDRQDWRASPAARPPRFGGCAAPARSRPCWASAGRPARGRSLPLRHSSSASSPPASRIGSSAPASSSWRARILRLTELSSTTSTRPLSGAAARATGTAATTGVRPAARGDGADQGVALATAVAGPPPPRRPAWPARPTAGPRRRGRRSGCRRSRRLGRPTSPAPGILEITRDCPGLVGIGQGQAEPQPPQGELRARRRRRLPRPDGW